MTKEGNLPDHLIDLWSRSSADLSEQLKNQLKILLLKHEELFAKGKGDTGQTDVVQHHIDTGDALPIKQRPRQVSIHLREEEKKHVTDMLTQGIITESQSP